MSRMMALLVLVALAVSVESSLAGKNDVGDKTESGGNIVRCSLNGVNPAYHPKIFGNPAVAASYGFVRSRDGAWRVQPNCQR